MFIIVGLGNHGKKYANTRHNAGFFAVDYLRRQGTFGVWRHNAKINASVSEGTLNDARVALIKPSTFMNRSGDAVRAACRAFNVRDLDMHLVVIHDDLDIPFGEFKLQRGRSSAGHKGVQSIIDALGTKEWTRIRIGIAPPIRTRESGETYVLKPFSKTEGAALVATFPPILRTLYTDALRAPSAPQKKGDC